MSNAPQIERARALRATPAPSPHAPCPSPAAAVPPVVAAKRAHGRGVIRAAVPGAQTAVVAAGGFAAGAVVFGLAARLRRNGRPRARARSIWRRAGHGARGRGTGGRLVEIVGTRSLLVDVHLLGNRER